MLRTLPLAAAAIAVIISTPAGAVSACGFGAPGSLDCFEAERRGQEGSARLEAERSRLRHETERAEWQHKLEIDSLRRRLESEQYLAPGRCSGPSRGGGTSTVTEFVTPVVINLEDAI